MSYRKMNNVKLLSIVHFSFAGQDASSDKLYGFCIDYRLFFPIFVRSHPWTQKV